MCIAHGDPTKLSGMFENYFHYPDEMAGMIEHIRRFSLDTNTYFCSQLLGAKKRNKDNVQTCTNLWADLDSCDPEKLLVPASVVLETSPGRYQALWILENPEDPEVAEDMSRRIAYHHSIDGADKSGWDLSQLLRIPLTRNMKYEVHGFPVVKVLEANQKKYTMKDFAAYPQAMGFEHLDIPFPDSFDRSAQSVLDEHKRNLNPRVWTLFYQEPESDWSRSLWQLEMMLFELDLSREDTFVVAREAACNKYKRDGRPEIYLWKEVCKAEYRSKKSAEAMYVIRKEDILKPLLTDKEREWVSSDPSIVEEYVEWAKTLGDAAWQYHQAGAFVILSSLLSGSVRLPTSYGLIVPNLWFLILADTTLTRKTTAMDIAVDIILEIDKDCILATDGSIEGLFTSLSARPGRSSIFLRDEFSGLLELMTKRDYYAGMAETLTKMYDGKFQKRVLRKETIEVREPVLIIFAGGIRTRIYELLNYDHITSGFMPRFVFIGADSDIAKLKPLGPPTEYEIETREKLLTGFRSIHDLYSGVQVIRIGEREVTSKRKWNASLTANAWVRYNRFEADMVASGLDSDRADILTPTMDRLAKSGLKMAILLAASRSDGAEVVVEEEDIVRSFYYIEQWVTYTFDLLRNIGKTTSERLLERVLRNVHKTPGIARSTLMQNHHLTAREADTVFSTLEQRGLVRRNRVGKAEYYEPVSAI